MSTSRQKKSLSRPPKFDAAHEIGLWSTTAVAIYAISVVAYLIQFSWSKAWSVLGVTVIIGASAFALGLLLGFLFGLPRTLDGLPPLPDGETLSTLQGGLGAREKPWPIYRSNTNLEQISDWLTKILVGVSLIQLVNVPTAMQSLGKTLKPALGNVASSETFAIGLVVFNSVAGFLIGYLVTRLRMAHALSSAEAAIRQEELAVQDAIRANVDSAEEIPDAEQMETGERTRVVEVEARVHRLEEAGGRLDADAYLLLARQLKRAGKYVEAESAYLKAAELQPTNPVPLNLAGVIRGKYMADYEGAEKLYRKAIIVDPTHISAIYNLACNEKRRGQTAQALNLLTVAISANPDKYRAMARSDDAFKDLRDDPRFQALTESDPPPASDP
ncbi:tetratricopeptide repeat protein [Streptomyces sp. NPDC058646]|uniref:tetratricopeptide repeat protein n=1 Tax=Streptomyces sp. NPDC058646 TaxID=3346574 RepID=UPI0036670594